MRRVAVVSRAGGGVGEEGRGVGEERWGRGGGACYRRYERLASTRTQCWLQMLAKSIWRATMSIPANMNLLEGSL